MRSASAPPPAALSIGELSRRAGVHIETIRYYERIKMLRAPPRTSSGRRIYGPVETRTLVFIRRSRELGFRSIKFVPCWPFPPRMAKRRAPKCGSSRRITWRRFG
jgi:hypothetical protein